MQVGQAEALHNAIYRLRHVLHHHVEIELIHQVAGGVEGVLASENEAENRPIRMKTGRRRGENHPFRPTFRVTMLGWCISLQV